MNKTEARAVLGALESITEVLDRVLSIRTLPESPDAPTVKAQEAMRIMRAEVLRSDGAIAVPQGWRLVPIEPTAKMISRGHHRIDFDRSQQNTFDPNDEKQRGEFQAGTTCGEDVREAYQAMLAAAPKVAAPGPICLTLLEPNAYHASSGFTAH
jgi:hypothetical protein